MTFWQATLDATCSEHGRKKCLGVVREEALDHMGVGLGQGKTAEREEVPGARGGTCLLVVLS